MKKLFNTNAFNPKNVIDYYQKKADRIRYDNNYNFEYTYWIKTPRGMVLNEFVNHQYGNSREGFEQWKKDNKHLIASQSNQVSLRSITDRSRLEKVIGYVTEEKLSDYVWHDQILHLVDDCFDKLCDELKVVDVPNFRFFMFDGLMGYENYADELKNKLNRMVDIFESYQTDDDFRKLVDKIKG